MYHCPICNDEEYLFFEKDGYNYYKPCKCQKIRRTIQNAKNSGLGSLLKTYRFENFQIDYDYQKDLYDKAQKYLLEDNKWFTILGKTGAGKTFICVSICRELLKKGKEVKFMGWIDESRKLKAHINDDEYDDMIESLKEAEVLYIDDFFKSENNTSPSNADIKLANEIIGYRYNKALAEGKGYQTIISSERTLQQLVQYDEALIGRIMQMSDKYVKLLGKNVINYRLKNFI